MKYDYCIIGGGIVGLATAMRLLEARPGSSLILLEKEDFLGKHQTGHNSGVIHAGIYYAPGSLKAELCRKGAIATKEFCEQNSIRYDVCGKLVVATSDQEVVRMDALYERSKQNTIEVHRLSAAELVEREPNIVGMGFIRALNRYRQLSRCVPQDGRAHRRRRWRDTFVDPCHRHSREDRLRGNRQ